ncbi:DUF6340 family protein [Bacteroidota bacterium]
MKTKILLLTLLVAVMFSSCSKYGYVNLSYPLEPKVYLPEGVDEIAVVNRSLTNEEAKNDKIREAIISTEIAGSDKLASDECIKGVFAASQNWRGMVIVIPETVRLEGTGTRVVPELLDWELVSEICAQEKTDALLVLETFDSNTDLLKQAAVEQVASFLSTGEPVVKAPNHINMNVACFWRLYEPESKTVIDQYQHNSTMSFNLIGGIPPIHALPETAYGAGVAYVNRFLPSYYTVRRDMYKRAKGPSKHQFRAGYRRAEVANWQGAIELWGELADDKKRKTAGRSCLNIAVGHEVLGNTEEALKWAQRSYEFYGDKLGRDYAKILLKRRRIEGN